MLSVLKTKEINIIGRTQLDMYVHMNSSFKLSSYSLNNVSAEFLNDQKEEIHYKQIEKLHQRDDESRRRIGTYCLKDAQLPMRLMEKLCCIYNYSEMARVTGVPINYLFRRGQQIKVVSQLHRFAKLQNIIINTEHQAFGKDQI